MKFKLFLVFILPLFIVSCASKVKVYKDGYPLPESTYHSRNIQTQMEVFANIAKYYEKGDKKDKYLYPKWLKIGESYGNFRNNPKYIGGTLKIINPKRIEYSVITTRNRKDRNEIIYVGSRPNNVLQIKEEYNRKDKNSKITVLIYKGYIDKLSEIKEKNSLFTIDLIQYNIE